MKSVSKIIRSTLTLTVTLTLNGCAGLSDTQQRSMTGSLGGAAAGAAIGAIAGNAGLGAVIGAGTGALGGFAYGKHKEAVNQAYQQGRSDAAQQPR